MTPEDALARAWRAMKRVGMLRVATLRPRQPGGAPVMADVMWDAPGVSPFEGVQSTEPSIRFRVADWPGAAPQDRAEIGAVIYEIREITPADDGLLASATLRRLN